MRENPTKKKQVSDRFLSLTEVGAILRLTDTEIQAWIASGELPTVSYQGSNIISEAELNEFLDRIRSPVDPCTLRRKEQEKENLTFYYLISFSSNPQLSDLRYSLPDSQISQKIRGK
jgi:hypothetical protein